MYDAGPECEQPDFDYESGATMVEYGLMLALIALVIFLIVQAVGLKVFNAFTNLDGLIP